jgi:hypothetical protein
VILLQARRIAGLTVCEHRHAGSTVDDCRISVVHAVWIACVLTGKERLSEQALLAIRINRPPGERQAGVEVANIAMHILLAGVEFVVQAVAEA